MARDTSLERGFAKLGFALGSAPYVRQQLELKRDQANAGIESSYALADERNASTALKQQELERVMSIASFLEDPKNGLTPQTAGLYNPQKNNPQQAAAADLGFQKKGIVEDVMAGAVAPGQLENALSLVGASAQVDASGQHRYNDTVTPGRERMDTAKIGALKALVGQRTAAAAKSKRAGGFTVKEVLAGYERDYPKAKNGKGRVNLLRPGEPIPTREQYASWYGADLGYVGPELSQPPVEEQAPPFMDQVFKFLGLGPDQQAAPDASGGVDMGQDVPNDVAPPEEFSADVPEFETSAPPEEYPDAQFDAARGVWIVERGGKKFAVQ